MSFCHFWSKTFRADHYSTLHQSWGTVYLHSFVNLLITSLLLRLPLALVSLISRLMSSRKIEISPLSHFLFTVICTHLGFSLTDIFGIDPAWLLHVIFISYQLIFTLFIVYATWLYYTRVCEYVVIKLLKFYKHYKSAPFHPIVPYHLITYHFVIYVHSSHSH